MANCTRRDFKLSLHYLAFKRSGHSDSNLEVALDTLLAFSIFQDTQGVEKNI